MNQPRQVDPSNVQAVYAVTRKHYRYTNVVVTVLNPSGREPVPSLPQLDPVRNLSWRDFRRPWWLAERAPELAYVPKDVTNCPVLGPFVGSLPRLEAANGGYRLCRWILATWTKTESQLTAMCDSLLEQRYGRAEAKFPLDSFWPQPSTCGYQKTYLTRHDAERAIKRSMDAFVALIARCSLAIALHSPPDSQDKKTDWIEFLMRKNVPAWWVDEFKESHVPNFAANSRVGCYVCPEPGTEWQTRWMNHVPIMARAGVPVYIIWPPEQKLQDIWKEFAWLRDMYPKSAHDLVYFVPWREEGPTRGYFAWKDLHVASATAASWIPDQTRAEPAVVVGQVGDGEQPPHGPGQRPGESFIQFCARRDRESKDLEAKETPQARTARLARQKVADTHSFPDRNTRMFVWEEIEIYHKNVRDEWASLDYRHLLGVKVRRTRWEEHAISQRRYDAFRDEWDLCKDMNPDGVPYVDGESDDDDYDVPVDTSPQQLPGRAQPVATGSQAMTSTSQRAVGRTNVSDNGRGLFRDFLGQRSHEEVRRFKPRFDEPSTIIRKRFGVVTDRSMDDRFTDNDCHPNNLRKVLGVLPSEEDSDLNLDAYTMNSFRGWAGAMAISRQSSSAPCAPQVVWDLHPRNRAYLSSVDYRHPNLRLSIEVLNGERWYKMSYANDEPAKWSVIVYRATTALELMRRRSVDSRTRAAAYLGERGMPFRTILVPDRANVGRLDSIPPTVLGYRAVNARFDKNDFRAYWNRAHDILYARRGRAAVLRGGIVWRIALELWGPGLMESATDGPSTDVYDTGEIYHPTCGDDYLDDQLTQWETDVICGVYHVLSGHQVDQNIHQSWWPKPNIWSSSSYDPGFWTPMAESWFQRRLAKMRAGEAQPYSTLQWKGNLRCGTMPVHVRNSLETVSKDYIDNDLRPAES